MAELQRGTTTADPAELLDLLGRLRDLYKPSGPRKPFSAVRAREVSDTLAAIKRVVEETDIDDQVVERRSVATPLHFGARHHILHGLVGADRLWLLEQDILAAHGITPRESNDLRVAAQAYFGRQAKRVRHPSQPQFHPLSDGGPLLEILEQLQTADVLAIGAKNRPSKSVQTNGQPRLTVRQKLSRRKMVDHDRRLLVAAIMIVANLMTDRPPIFRLSYTLAVGQVCLS